MYKKFHIVVNGERNPLGFDTIKNLHIVARGYGPTVKVEIETRENGVVTRTPYVEQETTKET